MRRLALLLTMLAAVLALPAPALAPPIGAGAVSDMLEAGDVAIDPDARVTDAERAALERAARQLRDEGIPVDFAVIRAEGLGAAEFADAVHRRLGYRGLVVVVVQEPRSIGLASEHFFITSPELRAAQARATSRLSTDMVGAAVAFAREGWRLGLQAEAEREQRRQDDDDDGTASAQGAIGVAAVLTLIGLVVWWRRIRKARPRRGRPMRPQAALEPMLDALAHRITDLQPRADDPEAGEKVHSAYAEAVIAYGKAQEALPNARTAAEAAGVQDAIERGLDAARRAEALLAGDRPPTTSRRRRRRGAADRG